MKRKRLPRFYIQKHRGRNLHYDFRLEISGVLKSWTIPKGPSLNPAEKRMAFLAADHPLKYGPFEGVIASDKYGMGPVLLWDFGEFEFVPDARNKKETPPNDPEEAFWRGALKLVLFGKKCKGRWGLIRIKGKGDPWLLVKDNDEFADREIELVDARPYSAKTHRTLEQIEEQDREIPTDFPAS